MTRKLSQAEIEVLSTALAERMLEAFKKHIGLTEVTERDASGNVISKRTLNEIREDREAAEYAQRRAAEDKAEMVRELMKRIQPDE